MNRKGFTLIELMIVIAIIAIIAAIAIPSLIRSTMSSNERNASGTCKTICSWLTQWRSADSDGNAIADYWTGDCSVLWRVVSGATRRGPCDDVVFAQADIAPRPANEALNPTAAGGGAPAVTTGAQLNAGGANAIPKSGYKYQMMTTDENGTAYQLQTVPGGADPALFNNAKFAICATPDVHGTTGDNIFIVNETTKIWRRNNGNNTPVLTWPDVNPMTKGWGSVE
jgi:prepilin-type N-terminal cleavage/methylation domain-containing protein